MSLIHEMMRFGGFIGSGSGNGSGGGVSSWNDLTDKPFYEETKVVNEPLNITWDGNTEGLTNIDKYPSFYKVSDMVLSIEQIKSVTVTMDNGYEFPITDSWDFAVVSDSAVATDAVIFALKDNASFNDMFDGIEINIREKGIYFNYAEEMHVSSITTTVPVEQTKTVVKKLDTKYLPDSVPYEEVTGVLEPINITWDGNTEGLVAVEVIPFYKVSDAVLTDEQIRASAFSMSDGNAFLMVDEWSNATITDDVVASELMMFARKAGAVLDDIVFPEAGIYFPKLTDVMYIASFTVPELPKTVVHKLDKKYLPDVVGGSNMIEYYTGALEGGQKGSGYAFSLRDLAYNDLKSNYYEIECLIELSRDSHLVTVGKFTYYLTDTSDYIVGRSDGIDDVTLSFSGYEDGSAFIMLNSGGTTTIDNPSMIYIRLYPKA